MTADTLSLNLPFPVVERPIGPLIDVDEKIVGSGITVSLVRGKHPSWDEGQAIFRNDFYVSVEAPGGSLPVWVGDGCTTLESAVVVYNRCNDSIG